MRPSLKRNRSPRQITVSDAKLHAQNPRAKKSLSGRSQRSRSTCPSRSMPTPTDSATATRASDTKLSRVKLQMANPLAAQLSTAHGTQYVMPSPRYPQRRESRVERAQRSWWSKNPRKR